MRSALAHVPKGQQTMVAAALRQAFLQPDQESARRSWRQVADQLRSRWPKLSALMDASEHDVLAYLGFPAQHRTKLHSTDPLKRLNKEVKRRADVVGIFPSEQSITRLIGAVLLEANDEWQLQHRYMQLEAMAELAPPATDAEPAQIPPLAAWSVATSDQGQIPPSCQTRPPKLRRAVRARGHFPTDKAAMKLLFLVSHRAENEWIMLAREWCIAKAQFAIFFGERFAKAMAG